MFSISKAFLHVNLPSATSPTGPTTGSGQSSGSAMTRSADTTRSVDAAHAPSAACDASSDNSTPETSGSFNPSTATPMPDSGTESCAITSRRLRHELNDNNAHAAVAIPVVVSAVGGQAAASFSASSYVSDEKLFTKLFDQCDTKNWRALVEKWIDFEKGVRNSSVRIVTLSSSFFADDL
jgi:hypothetical protein